jgi:phosphoglycerate dehydrogenase-like enzyme
VTTRVVAALGRFAGMASMLDAAVPGVEIVPWSEGEPVPDGAEVLATLPAGGDPGTGALVPEIRWVHVLAAGVDGFPLEHVGDRVVTCSRGATAPAIAEFVLACMLAFEKQLPDAWVTEPPEHWTLAALGGLTGKTLGLVGVGAIGTEVARRALAFDMRVVAHRRTDAPMPVDGMGRIDTLPELLSQADHVVLAAPATPETHHLLDADAFATMKAGAHLVNVSRGTLVDQEALVAALDGGRLALASLDVYDPEPLPAGHPLYAHPKVRLSPHISWSSPGSLDRTIGAFATNVERWHRGEPLTGLVDVTAGY